MSYTDKLLIEGVTWEQLERSYDGAIPAEYFKAPDLSRAAFFKDQVHSARAFVRSKITQARVRRSLPPAFVNPDAYESDNAAIRGALHGLRTAQAAWRTA